MRLADTLVSDFDIVEFLHGLSVDSVEILRAAAAGVMLADARGRLRLIASSDERMRLLELFEIQGAQGPCLDAFSSGRALQASAADSRVRWPVFAPQASGAGFQTMCAVPLRARTEVIGALNLFRGDDEPFTGTEMEIAQAMAEMAAIGLIHERALRERNMLVGQLQAALNSRVVIEQAKGILAEYLTITVDEAFTLLRIYARDHNLKLSEIAADVVNRKIPAPPWPGDPTGSPSGQFQPHTIRPKSPRGTADGLTLSAGIGSSGRTRLGAMSLADMLSAAFGGREAPAAVPAASAAVVVGHDEVVAAWGADRGTLFQAASISKPVAALMTLRLAAQDRLSLDADVNEYLRSWRLPDGGAGRAPVTIRHLLCHGGALTVSGFPGYAQGAPRPSLTEILDGLPPSNTPGAEMGPRAWSGATPAAATSSCSSFLRMLPGSVLRTSRPSSFSAQRG